MVSGSCRPTLCKVGVALLCLVSLVLVGIGTFADRNRHDFYTSPEQEDVSLQVVTGTPERGPSIISAYFGLDDTFPLGAELFCARAGGADGMPLVFSHEVDPDTMEAGDFKVYDSAGRQTTPFCASLRPAISPGELRTVLLIGQFGTATLQRVCVVGHILDIAHTVDFKGICLVPKPMSGVPDLVFAEVVPNSQQNDCPESANHLIVRATFDGGVTLEGAVPVTPDYASKFTVTLTDNTTIVPTVLGDIQDQDNNQLLCFSESAAGNANSSTLPKLVSFEAGHYTDPNEDGTNLATSVSITRTDNHVLPAMSAEEVTSATATTTALAVVGTLAVWIVAGLSLRYYMRRKKPKERPSQGVQMEGTAR